MITSELVRSSQGSQGSDRMHFQAHSDGCWQYPIPHCLLTRCLHQFLVREFLHRVAHSMKAGSIKWVNKRWRDQLKTEATVFFSLTLVMTSCWSESVSHSVVSDFCDPKDCSLCPWNSPSKNTGVGYPSLLQGIFLKQGSNLGLLQCKQIPSHLSHLLLPYSIH